MGINFGYHHDERYIEDVHPAEGDGFDVREPHVRHQAIGALDERYTRFRSFLGHASAPDEGTIIPVKVYPKYTRVPPLETFDGPIQLSQRASTSLMHVRLYLQHGWSTTRRVFQRAGSWASTAWQATRYAFATGIADTLAFAGRTGQALSSKGRYWLPEKYSLARGVYADWQTRILTWLKWAVLPLALAVGLFFLFAMPLEQGTNTPGKAPSTQKPAQKSPKPTTSPGVSPAKPGNTSTGTTSNNPSPNEPSKPTTASSPPPSTSTYVDPPPVSSQNANSTSTVAPDPTPSAGSSTSSAPAPSGANTTGSGSSASQPPPSSSSSSSGLIPNTTVTVPPVKATISGKPLVSTNGTSLSLN